ncbi:Rcr1p [Saccharomyces cerevisiae YJM1419]
MGLISYENEAINEVKKADNHHVSKFVTSYYGPSSSSWQSGRWILFVLFVAAIILIILFTFVANRRRRRMGRAPIRGTAWLTPPSYRQSQQQYTGTVQQRTDDYVPEYTETANEHDLGYYDQRGEFHPNDEAAYVAPPPLVQECSSESVNSLERPPAAVVHQANSLDTDYGLTRPSNGRVPAVSDTVEQLERLPGGTTTQEINPPERAKVNARS